MTIGRLIGWASFPLLALVAAASPAADFDGDGTDDIATFRPNAGLWAVRGVTRLYLGAVGDIPVPADLDGNGRDEAAVFRPYNGLWAAAGVTRAYFGADGDVPLGKGGFNPYTSRYDYVVMTGDGADLVRALESNLYGSVYVPSGTYLVSETINIDHVQQVTGEQTYATVIEFPAGVNGYLSVEQNNCHLERISTLRGGTASPDYLGAFHLTGAFASLRECRSDESRGCGFTLTDSADYASFIDCVVTNANHTGFAGIGTAEPSARFTNCAARNCEFMGFYLCRNLSSCYVYGNRVTDSGFSDCENLSSSLGYNCADQGFRSCRRVSACTSSGGLDFGFYACFNLAGCYAQDSPVAFSNCWYVSSASFSNCTTGYDSCVKVDPDSCQ